MNWLPQPFEWIFVPAGKVTLGEDLGTVTLSAFEMAKYPITVSQYEAFIEANGYQTAQYWTGHGWQRRQDEAYVQPRYWLQAPWHKPDYPVVGISWYEAMAFCAWLSETAGEDIRLPSEAQWQRAAQGDDQRKFPWGSRWDATRCNNSVSAPSQGISSVVAYPTGASPYGVMDMSGNVWEWTLTEWVNEEGATWESQHMRIYKGGYWKLSNIELFKVTDRKAMYPNLRYHTFGFRTARILNG